VRTILVPVLGNTTVGPDKTLLVTLSNPAGASLARAQATGTIVDDDPTRAAVSVEQLRLYHPGTREHLFTTDVREYAVLAQQGWRQEGAAYTMFADSGTYNGSTTVPLYRLRHAVLGHHWTTDPREAKVLAEGDWDFEGIPGYVLASEEGGTAPLYRLRLTSAGLHVWTADAHEKDELCSTARGWVNEGRMGNVLR